MIFEVVAILSEMENFYQQPISGERFMTYLSKLQGGSKGELKLPISGFNPMAKSHILDKIKELTALDAEKIMTRVLEPLNDQNDLEVVKVVLNLADDQKGGWTNHYTTDFDSKFKFNALVSRNFCTPHFWTNEQYTEQLIGERAMAYAYRTIYWLKNPKPKNMADYLDQEIFVCQQLGMKADSFEKNELTFIQEFFQIHQESDDYNILFNFFYGDKASSSLNYPSYGIDRLNGFEYAKIIADS